MLAALLPDNHPSERWMNRPMSLGSAPGPVFSLLTDPLIAHQRLGQKSPQFKAIICVAAALAPGEFGHLK
jgi:hypothetical protein